MELLQEIINKPLALEVNWAKQYFANILAKRNVKLVDPQGKELVSGKPTIKAITGGSYNETGGYLYKVDRGVAIIPVIGPLSHRYSWWYYGYRELAEKLQKAVEDPEVRSILLDMETPGGTVAGLPDFCGLVKKIDGIKPVFSLVNDMAASAGMAIASQTRRRFVTQNGELGSIGCVIVHMNYEALMENIGIEATMIFSGAHKVDGNPYQKLPESVVKQLQLETDSFRQEFAELVSSNMPLDTQKLLDTEAQMYRGQDAIDLGLADEMVNAYEIIEAVTESPKSIFNIGIDMSDPKSIEKKEQAEAKTEQQAKAEAKSAAVAERERIKAIVDSDDGKANPALASYFAYDTDMSTEQALGALAASAKGNPQPSQSAAVDTPLSGGNSGFEAAMAKENPEVSAETEDDTAAGAQVDDELEAMCSIYRPERK